MFVITLQGGATPVRARQLNFALPNPRNQRVPQHDGTIQTIEFVPAIQADNATIPLSSISGITWDA